MARILWDTGSQDDGFTVMSNGMVWPDDWPGTLVKGHFVTATGDGSDADRDPDMQPAGYGTITFSPSVSTVSYSGEHGNRVVRLEPFTAQVDDQGRVITGTDEGVVLPSNDADVVTPQEFSWRVNVDIPGIPVRQFEIPTPADGQTIWLNDYLNHGRSPAVVNVVDRSTAKAAAQARDEAIQVAKDVEEAGATALQLSGRVGNIETMAGLAPGEVTDAQTANLVNRTDTETRAELNTVIAEQISTTAGGAGWLDVPTDLIAARLTSGISSLTIGVAGDSTLNDSNDGVRVWLANLGPLHPDLRIEYGLWNDANQTMQTPLAVLQQGTATSSTGGPGTVVDSFDRPATELHGTVADTGQTWATSGVWATNGSAAYAPSSPTGRNAVIPCGVTGDMSVEANITFDTSGGATKSFMLLSNYDDGNNSLWVQVSVSASGITSGSIWKRIGNTPTQIGTFSSLGIAQNSTTTYDVSIELSALDVTATINGVTATGSITETDYAALGEKAGFSSANAGTANSVLINHFTVNTPLVPGEGQTLTVYNGATPGKSIDYHTTRLPAIFPTAPDVLLFSSGHNHGTDSPATYLAAMGAFVTAAETEFPDTLFLVASQNPQFAPASTVAPHLARQSELRPWARRHGYGYVPILEAYQAEPDGGKSRVSTDGVHPTVGSDPSSGASLWSQTVQAHIRKHVAAS